LERNKIKKEKLMKNKKLVTKIREVSKKIQNKKLKKKDLLMRKIIKNPKEKNIRALTVMIDAQEAEIIIEDKIMTTEEGIEIVPIGGAVKVGLNQGIIIKMSKRRTVTLLSKVEVL
jgi:hypothetical protein